MVQQMNLGHWAMAAAVATLTNRGVSAVFGPGIGSSGFTKELPPSVMERMRGRSRPGEANKAFFLGATAARKSSIVAAIGRDLGGVKVRA